MTDIGGFHLGNEQAAKHLVMTYHYSHRWPSNVQVIGTWHEPGGLFGDAGEPLAACIFSIPPTRWAEPVWELSRLVRVEGVDVSLSGLISTTAKWARNKGADVLVSFADATHGHHGGVYQAASWHYDGQRASANDGCVINGQFVPGRTLNGLFGTRSPGLLKARGVDATAHYDIGKHLYWRSFARSGKAKAARLGLRSMPYPKPDALTAEAVA